MKEEKKICAWCLKEQGRKIEYDPANLVTHGMCKRHFKAATEKFETETSQKEIKEAA